MATTLTRDRSGPQAGNRAARSAPSPAGSLTAARRSAPLAVAGIACMLLGGLAAASVYLRLDDRVTALVVTRAVGVGQVVTEADLGTVELSADGLSLVPARDRPEVVGRTAAVALPAGSLLTDAALGQPAELRPGEAVVGLALKAGQAPAQVRAGDRVAVVDTDAPPGSDAGARRPATLTEEGTVLSVARGEANGTTSLSLRLPRPVAAAVAAAGAAGHVSLVLLPPAP